MSDAKIFQLDNCKSYATEKALMKKLETTGLINMMPVICCNREGRWTAIFGLDNAMKGQGGYLGFASQYGFLTIS
jgi:hypothetical protein